jgi:hypothetical protein
MERRIGDHHLMPMQILPKHPLPHGLVENAVHTPGYWKSHPRRSVESLSSGISRLSPAYEVEIDVQGCF